MLLRPHHLLCLQLYEGKGYSDAFCTKMDKVVRELLQRPQSLVRLVVGGDELCETCPHYQGAQCTLGQDNVVERDLEVLRAFSLQPEQSIAYAQIIARMRANLSQETFLQICAHCQWLGAGVCSWQKLSCRMDLGPKPQDNTE